LQQEFKRSAGVSPAKLALSEVEGWRQFRRYTPRKRTAQPENERASGQQRFSALRDWRIRTL